MRFRFRSLRSWVLKSRKGIPLPAAVNAFCQTLTQGMVLNTTTVPEVRREGLLRRRTPHGVVIVSQTCDIVQRKTTAVVVAVVRRLDEETAKGAKDGARPRFVHLPALGERMFVDLDHIATFHKARLLRYTYENGLSDDDDQRRFAQLVGRRFSRHAFPDEISPWLTPLQGVVARSVLRGEDALKRVFDEIDQLRVQASTWNTFPTDVTLHVIVRAGELPPPSEELPEPSDSLRAWLAQHRSYKEVAKRLFPAAGNRPIGDDRQILWDEFGEALKRLCKPSNKDIREISGTETAVSSFEVQVSNDDEFTLAQVRKTERLDLAHLSKPEPREG